VNLDIIIVMDHQLERLVNKSNYNLQAQKIQNKVCTQACVIKLKFIGIRLAQIIIISDLF